MAPEVVGGENYTEKVDLFSFGAIIYFLISGKSKLLYMDIIQKKHQEIINELSDVI